MLFFRNRLVFGIIKKILSSIFKALYAIIKVFNLQLFLFVLVVGGIVYLTGGFNGSELVKLAFYVLAGLSLLYALIETFRKLFGFDKKKKEKRNKTAEGKKEFKTQESNPAPDIIDVVAEKPQKTEQSQPKYFRVKDSKDLIMAEYDDRVELYRLESGKMVKIRTDYKTER